MTVTPGVGSLCCLSRPWHTCLTYTVLVKIHWVLLERNSLNRPYGKSRNWSSLGNRDHDRGCLPPSCPVPMLTAQTQPVLQPLLHMGSSNVCLWCLRLNWVGMDHVEAAVGRREVSQSLLPGGLPAPLSRQSPNSHLRYLRKTSTNLPVGYPSGSMMHWTDAS